MKQTFNIVMQCAGVSCYVEVMLMVHLGDPFGEGML